MSVEEDGGAYVELEKTRPWEHRDQIDNCPLYDSDGLCDPEHSLRDVRLYREERDRYYPAGCGGCDFFTGFMEQWRQEVVEFHELLHGPGRADDALS